MIKDILICCLLGTVIGGATGYVFGKLHDMSVALKVYRLELERLRKKVDDGH